MDGIRQQLFIDYMYYLNETDRFYATKARYAKHVLDFLESASSVDRRGFMAFKRDHSLEMANDYSCGTAICDFLNFCGKGYNRKKKSKVKTLEKLSVVSDKNKEQLNGFMAWIEEAGGSWRGGKVQGFVFPFNAERVFSILHDGKRCNLQQDFQFFETPPNVADWLVMISGGISDEDSVLEPSAGRGGLIKSIHRSNPSVIVDCYELMPENKEFLQKMENVRILGDDFTKGEHSTYSKIIANPPFSHNQDIYHVRMMYEFLKEGGTLAAITSKHWEFSNEKKCEDFRAWISSVNGEVFNIPQGEFDCSGTPIETRAIIIRKNVL